MKFTRGNLFDADVEALVNTVNTVGVMGKGIALMFKERFPAAFLDYEEACSSGKVHVGKMHVFERNDFYGPKWIINFPTKKHWRHPSKMQWISDGLDDLTNVIAEKSITSVAIPPLGAGNGKLDWSQVRLLIEEKLSPVRNCEIFVYEPTQKYQNVAKRSGVEKLTPARALMAEVIRRYGVLDAECTILEAQKLAYIIGVIGKRSKADPMKLQFSPHFYGPYSDDLRHLLDSLDGSYILGDKRINDSGPFDVINFNDSKKEFVQAYFTTDEAKPFKGVLEAVTSFIEGFETPLGMELLTTVDWLLREGGAEASLSGVKRGVAAWPAGGKWAQRKQRIFEDRHLEVALKRVQSYLDPTPESA